MAVKKQPLTSPKAGFLLVLSIASKTEKIAKYMSEKQTCPLCGKAVETLIDVEPGLKLRLSEIAGETSIPDSACNQCFKGLGERISTGAQFRLKEKAKEQQKLMMWNSRVTLLKQGRNYMISRMYSEAALAYEKYIRVLEIIFNIPPGKLDPLILKDAHQTKELAIIASVFWDLVQIYDSSPRYGNRQAEAARKLSIFIKYTPVYPDIIRRATAFSKKCKNPAVLKKFLKAANANKPKCFIATYAFNYPYSPEILLFCHFRDQILAPNPFGQMLIRSYYHVSPKIVSLLEKAPFLRPFLRAPLRLIYFLLLSLFHTNS